MGTPLSLINTYQMSLISIGSMSLDITFNFMLISKTGRKNKYLWPKVRSIAYRVRSVAYAVIEQ